MEPLFEFLRSNPNVEIIGPDSVESRAPTISIMPQKNLKDVYEALTKHKLMLGIGHFYGVRPLMDMDIPLDPGVIRISFVHYTSPEEIDQLIKGLDKVLS
jgi:selenocysteine lyase/cysteine desulfurase